MSNEKENTLSDKENDTPFKEKISLYILTGATVLIGTSWALMFIPTLANSWKYQNNHHQQ